MNVHPHQLALLDRKGTAPMYLQCGSVVSSLLKPTWTATRETVQVTTMTLDEVCPAHDIDEIDILKVEAEGAEIKVFREDEKVGRTTVAVDLKKVAPRKVDAPTIKFCIINGDSVSTFMEEQSFKQALFDLVTGNGEISFYGSHASTEDGVQTFVVE